MNGSLTSLDVKDNRIGAEGAKALGEALKVNQTLQSVKYAASHPKSNCQHPLTPAGLMCGYAISETH